METRIFTGFKNVLIAGGYSGVSEIVHDRVVEEQWVLGNEADAVAEATLSQ